MTGREWLIGAAALLLCVVRAGAQEVRVVWNESRHAAFTDLAEFEGALVCAFRQGERHVHGADGVARVVASRDGGDSWETVGVVAEEGFDLRDPKLSVTPDGRLMLLMGGSVYRDRELVRREPRVAFCESLEGGFGPPTPVRIGEGVRTENDWLWRVTWREGVAWGVVYHIGDGENRLTLLRSGDGVGYEPVAPLGLTGKPGETTLRFDAAGRMIALVRCEGGDRAGRVGVSASPYTDWSLRELPVRLGGPELVVLPDGSLLAGTRRYPTDDDGETRTVIARVDTGGGWEVLRTLPSGGDTSYPGMLVRGENLLMSYYSSHEGRASVYLATIPLVDLVR